MKNNSGALRQQAILVVEKDPGLRSMISQTLRGDGYFVLALADDTTVLETAQDNPFSLILLDAELQRAVDICRQLRANSKLKLVPLLLFVTHEDEIAQIISKNVDVDDYLVRPPLREELRACACTLLRNGRRSIKPRPARILHQALSETVPVGEPLMIADLSIDVAKREIQRCNRTIELDSPLLFDLLVYLVRHRGVVLTPQQLLRHVWGYDSDSLKTTNVRTVYVHMHWLRKLLADDPNHPHYIQTIRGIGYCFKGEA